MSETIPFDLVWWISMVEIPALGGLLWLIWRTRRESEQAAQHSRRQCETTSGDLRERLSLYKLEVAKDYASIACLKDLERRLTSHLLRIEAKLDHSTGLVGASRGGQP
ncbi:MAG: hypothetical protein HOO00_02040 [Rhodospirillaceae bacterium]|jgi:hypothetical protein|nr:hypothetical protein [Rhodospirillaceae bacterium]MBT5373853.1 hypothetical protein [Rhodospirillaceae bacterium]MBT5752849.1 hypothetical protein [Rhodospirillaceae bacterium]